MVANLNRQELEVWKTYCVPGCSSMNRVKLNAVFFSKANSEVHELKKAEVCWELKKEGINFVTEAERNSKDYQGKKRRIDIVDLTNDIEIELETTPERAVRFLKDPVYTDKRILVIPVGWNKKNSKVWQEALNKT